MSELTTYRVQSAQRPVLAVDKVCSPQTNRVEVDVRRMNVVGHPNAANNGQSIRQHFIFTLFFKQCELRSTYSMLAQSPQCVLDSRKGLLRPALHEMFYVIVLHNVRVRVVPVFRCCLKFKQLVYNVHIVLLYSVF